MSNGQRLKLIHFLSTAWFMLCVVYVLVLVLRQAGFDWWMIFSVSGYSTLLVLLLVSFYLFAIFRGLSSGQEIIEHPLTSTTYYKAFYVVSPFLGGIAGLIGVVEYMMISEKILTVALGSISATFLAWVIVDPLASIMETLGPVSRRHRSERLRVAKQAKAEKQKEHDKLIAEILTAEAQERQRWKKQLGVQAEKLAEILTQGRIDKALEQEVIEIGLFAWRLGGQNCMKELHLYALELAQKRDFKRGFDLLQYWWDGIGNWRNNELNSVLN